MKTVAVVVSGMLVIAGSAICHGADVFYLTNAIAHTNYGPFEYVHGGKVAIDGQTFEIRRVLDEDERLKYRLQKIIVPEIEFRGAVLSNVVEFFQFAASQYERTTEEGTNTIRFVLSGQCEGAARVPEDLGSRIIDEGALRYVSLYTAVQEVCRVADLEFKIQNGTVVFMKGKAKRGQQPAGKPRDKPAPQP